MTLVKRSDWPSTLAGSWLSDFFNDERFLTSPWLRGHSVPAVNIKETDKSYDLEMAAPGLTKNDFKIEVDNNVLTVSAEQEEQREEKEDSYTRREFGYTHFSRSFNLPTNTNEDDIKARYEDGVLKLSIAKKGQSESKKRKPIEVK